MLAAVAALGCEPRPPQAPPTPKTAQIGSLAGGNLGESFAISICSAMDIAR
jgi:hypothetical protein